MSVMTKVSAINEMKGMINKFPDYSLGEILFTICREATFKTGTGKLSDLKELTADQILSAVEAAMRREQEETEFYN